MFTGLVQQVGVVKGVSRSGGLTLEIAFVPWDRPLEPGESVAVNGVCLTVVQCVATSFTANVLEETVSRTGLAELVPGAKVNLERALRAGDALGGHLVQGHVDCRGTIAAILPKGRDVQLRVRCTSAFAAHSVFKGSVAIDGVSLTISRLGDDWFAVDLIPTTRAHTTLGSRRVGDRVNLESDVLGRYANRPPAGRAGLTEAKLVQAGFI